LGPALGSLGRALWPQRRTELNEFFIIN